jgi:uncharacterized protein
MTRLAGPPVGLIGSLLEPDRLTGLGVLVLGGSSGRVDVDRARLFADRGALSFAMQWFGGAGQPASVCEIPLESFSAAIDSLKARGCERIAVVGTSKSGEGALLLATREPRIDVVAAFSPGSMVWESTGRPAHDPLTARSSFSVAGRPLPFVAYDAEAAAAVPTVPPIPYLELHLRTLERTPPDVLAAATIPLERSTGQIILVAGEDDALWPSAQFAREAAARMAAHGKQAQLITHPAAGHRILLPTETTPRSTRNAHGGTDEADRALGGEAWLAICAALELRP